VKHLHRVSLLSPEKPIHFPSPFKSVSELCSTSHSYHVLGIHFLKRNKKWEKVACQYRGKLRIGNTRDQLQNNQEGNGHQKEEKVH